jgi:iron(III) transport system substrate-binding protein
MSGLRRAAILLAAILSSPPSRGEELLVYTALETDQLKVYADAFARHSPGVELRFVRDSNGALTAKLLAEKANPRADVILGVAVTSMEIFKAEGLLAPYAPAGLRELTPAYVDRADPPAWVGQDVFTAVICYNSAEGARKGIPRPETWQDLRKPVYRGEVAMPSPASSGTGFLVVSSWLQLWGNDAGWKFMDALHANIVRYTHSGSKPCVEAGAGSYVVGIALDTRGNDVKVKGAPIDVVIPREGLGWDLEASGIVKTTKHMDAARKLMDWVASRDANRLYARSYAIVARPDVKPALAYLPADLGRHLIANDFAFAARHREAILAEWVRRYAAKAED